jgi:hypothetical protein
MVSATSYTRVAFWVRGVGLVVGLLVLGANSAVAAQPVGTVPDVTVTVTVDPVGRYSVVSHAPELSLSGDVGHPLSNIRAADGQDGVGAFHEVLFDYQAGGPRTSGIRVYGSPDTTTPVVLFTTTYTTAGPNTEPFPVLNQLPDLPYKLSYRDTPFSPYQLNSLDQAADSPWLAFDATGTGFLISPAANFAVARMSLASNGSLASGIDAGVASLPAGFTHQTLLVAGSGPNHLFDAWGAAMTTLHNKSRPANDADLTLAKLGYWTDNGAAYYYHFESPLGYAGTLLGVKHEFDQRGIALGYLQLDSWWYPKGPNARWDDTADGIFRYRAAPELFPDGLSAFQQQVGLPLVTHARWIDPASPYRGEFTQGFSGNVMTDPRYWANLMSYLQSAGVVTYEQDWLGAQAQPVYDLSAPEQFMGNMASAAAQRGMTVQYCMPLPRHVLQTVEYGNVTTTRVSDDRFDRNRWDTFLYASRLAGALGVWPWTDVFMSTEQNNLLLATLSAGVVGIGDPLGAEDAANLRRVMRTDAVLVKPDAPLVPTDESVLAEAKASGSAGSGSFSKPPMVASTFTDHGGMRALYVFAYARDSVPQTATFQPSTLGLTGATYVYDVYADAGRLLGAGELFSSSVSSGFYSVVAPVGASGIAFLGDQGEFVSLGQKRISQLADDGTLHATIEFAGGEQAVTLHGFAPAAPTVASAGGSIDSQSYDPGTQRFSFVVRPDTTPSSVTVALSVNPVTP